MLVLFPLLAGSSLVDKSFVEDVMASIFTNKPILIFDSDSTSFSEWAGMMPFAMSSMDQAKVRRFPYQ